MYTHVQTTTQSLTTQTELLILNHYYDTHTYTSNGRCVYTSGSGHLGHIQVIQVSPTLYNIQV